MKENIEKLKRLNKEGNEKRELTKKLQLKEKIISIKDSEINELKSRLDETLILNKKLKLEKEKMKRNNINNEDLQKEVTKKERNCVKIKGFRRKRKTDKK